MRNTAQARVEARIAAYASQPAPEAAPANGLVHYEQAKAALADAVRIDDAKTIRDKAEAIGVYAAQSKDTTLHVYATKIKLRAERRLGELSKQLEKAELAGRGTVSLPSSGKTKAATLKDAGISTSQAHRYEKLAALEAPVFDECVETATARKPNASTDFLLRVAQEMKQWDDAEQFVKDNRGAIARHEKDPATRTSRHWASIVASLKGLSKTIAVADRDIGEPLDDYETLRDLWSIVRPYLDMHVETK